MDVFQLLLQPIPTDFQPDSLYFILDGDDAQTFITDDSGIPKRVGNSQMIFDVVTDNIAFATINDVAISPTETWSSTQIDAAITAANAANSAAITALQSDLSALTARVSALESFHP